MLVDGAQSCCCSAAVVDPTEVVLGTTAAAVQDQSSGSIGQWHGGMVHGTGGGAAMLPSHCWGWLTLTLHAYASHASQTTNTASINQANLAHLTNKVL